MPTLSGKTLFISGASRGIGLAIGLRAARDGANVAIAAKTTEPHPKLPGTIYTAAKEIEAAGGAALPLAVDIRDELQVEDAVARTVEAFGGIDVLVNNASAISLTDTLDTPIKRFDLMQQINARGTFLCSQKCVPHLRRSDNPHVLTLSPPLDMQARWFAPHVAYTIAKYGMSLCVLGMAEEFRADGIAFNALWPRTIVDTAALRDRPRHRRHASAPADALAVDRGGRRARHPYARSAQLHGQFLHRRGRAAVGRRDRLLALSARRRDRGHAPHRPLPLKERSSRLRPAIESGRRRHHLPTHAASRSPAARFRVGRAAARRLFAALSCAPSTVAPAVAHVSVERAGAARWRPAAPGPAS